MMKRWLVVAGVALLAAALVFFNMGVKRSALSDHDDDEQPQQTQTQTSAPASVDTNAALPAEETIGDPAAAKHHVVVGWAYTEGNQRKPETLNDSLQAVRDFAKQSNGAVSAEIADLDVPQEDRSPAARTVTSLGIQVDGQSLYNGDLSTMKGGSRIIFGALTGAINGQNFHK